MYFSQLTRQPFQDVKTNMTETNQPQEYPICRIDNAETPIDLLYNGCKACGDDKIYNGTICQKGVAFRKKIRTQKIIELILEKQAEISQEINRLKSKINP